MNLTIFNLGLVEFGRAWEFQKEIHARVCSGEIESALVLCRHYPVITLGRNTAAGSLLVGEQDLKARGIPVYKIERGGDVTYHYPGQLVAYPIFNLNLFGRDLHLFLRRLEEAAVDFFCRYTVSAQRRPGLTGAWAGDKKIASIGIAVKRWVSLHGLSINIEKRGLEGFSLIRPCGMDIKMLSLEEAAGSLSDWRAMQEDLILCFEETFHLYREEAGV